MKPARKPRKDIVGLSLIHACVWYCTTNRRVSIMNVDMVLIRFLRVCSYKIDREDRFYA